MWFCAWTALRAHLACGVRKYAYMAAYRISRRTEVVVALQTAAIPDRIPLLVGDPNNDLVFVYYCTCRALSDVPDRCAQCWPTLERVLNEKPNDRIKPPRERCKSIVVADGVSFVCDSKRLQRYFNPKKMQRYFNPQDSTSPEGKACPPDPCQSKSTTHRHPRSPAVRFAFVFVSSFTACLPVCLWCERVWREQRRMRALRRRQSVCGRK